MNSKLLACFAALSLSLALGCGPSQTPESQEPQTVTEQGSCPKNQYLCTSCDGTRTYCADACLDCTPPVAPPSVEAQGTCPKNQYLCTSCDGLSTYCAAGCLDCTPPAAPTGEVEASAATCREGTQLCTRCDGTGTYCAIRCFLCADPIAAE